VLLPDEKAFNINLGLKLVYNDKNVDFFVRIHSDDWFKESFQVMVTPDITEIIQMVADKAISEKQPAMDRDYGEFDLLHSVRLSMYQALFVFM